MSRTQDARRALKQAEEAFVEAARARAAGAPLDARYHERLESLLANADALRMNPRHAN